MYINRKNSTTLKTRSRLRSRNFLIFFYAFNPDQIKLISVERNLKELNVDHYKSQTKVVSNILKNSIFRIFSSVVESPVLLVDPIKKYLEFDIESLEKSFSGHSLLVLLKLNNKLYSTAQLKNLRNFSYRKNIFKFCCLLDRYLKVSCVLASGEE